MYLERTDREALAHCHMIYEIEDSQENEEELRALQKTLKEVPGKKRSRELASPGVFQREVCLCIFCAHASSHPQLLQKSRSYSDEDDMDL